MGLSMDITNYSTSKWEESIEMRKKVTGYEIWKLIPQKCLFETIEQTKTVGYNANS